MTNIENGFSGGSRELVDFHEGETGISGSENEVIERSDRIVEGGESGFQVGRGYVKDVCFNAMWVDC